MLAGLYITPKGFTVARKRFSTNRRPRLSAKQLPTKSIRSAAPISKSAFGISISVLNRIIRICNQSISLRGFAIPAIPSCAFSPQPLHLL